MLDEGFRIGSASPTTRPQLVFPRGQWTDDSHERFKQHKSHRQRVEKAKAKIGHKTPAEKVSQPNDDKATDHKRHKSEVNRQDRVSQERVPVQSDKIDLAAKRRKSRNAASARFNVQTPHAVGFLYERGLSRVGEPGVLRIHQDSAIARVEAG